MRGLLLLAALILIGVVVGWITFHREPGRATINIETQEIRKDTKGVMQSGANLLHKAGDEIAPGQSTAEQQDTAKARR